MELLLSTGDVRLGSSHAKTISPKALAATFKVSRRSTPCVDALSKRDRIELGVGRLFLIEVARQEADHFVVTELLGPCDQRTVPADLVMLDGLRARDDRHIQHDFVVHFAGA